MFCKNCGTENIDESKFCKNCGQPLEEEQNSDSYTGPVEYDSIAHSVTDSSEIPESTGTAIASMILGIVSIVLCCSSILGMIAGVIAIVLAQKERNSGRGDNGYVKAGFICGIIGAILSVLMLIYYIVVMLIGGVVSTSHWYY